MSVLEENIKRVNSKLQALLKLHQQLQKENAQLKTALSEMKSRQEQHIARIAVLEQQAVILKASAGKMEEPDRRNFEKHIDQYIREIDKCIGLLSE